MQVPNGMSAEMKVCTYKVTINKQQSSHSPQTVSIQMYMVNGKHLVDTPKEQTWNLWSLPSLNSQSKVLPIAN